MTEGEGEEDERWCQAADCGKHWHGGRQSETEGMPHKRAKVEGGGTSAGRPALRFSNHAALTLLPGCRRIFLQFVPICAAFLQTHALLCLTSTHLANNGRGVSRRPRHTGGVSTPQWPHRGVDNLIHRTMESQGAGFSPPCPPTYSSLSCNFSVLIL